MEHGHGAILLETLTITLFAAVGLQIIASRLRVPAIVFLLIGGILLGPEVLHLVEPDALGSGLATVIALAVAIILFEGGLSLELEGFRLAGRVINRMLTLGVAVTWAATVALILVLYDFSASFAVLAASLTIVTGPTVIGPILRRVRVSERLHHILHWEGVLIDPIGVFLALSTYEWLQSQATGVPILQFAGRLALALPVGALVGWLIGWVLKHDWIDKEWDNLFVLASALGAYGLCDVVLTESGLLAVTVAGFVLSQQRSRRVKRIKKFKLEITQLAVGMLFILLAARLELAQFGMLGLSGIVLLGMMALIRPLNIAVSTVGSDLPKNERAFLAFLAPRGIVAASMASLFTIRLADNPTYAGSAWFLEAFTYAVIGVTVVIQGLGAPWVARLLGVEASERRTWLIVGARYFGQDLAVTLRRAGIPAILVDVNRRNIREARRRGLHAVEADILDVNLFDDTRFVDVGTMLCATGNALLDELACHRWQESLGNDRCYRWWHEQERVADAETAGVRRGVRVWPHLADLRQLESDLECGVAAIEALALKPNDRVDGETVKRLFDLEEGTVSLVAREPSVEAGEDRRVIVLSRKEQPIYSPVRGVVTLDDSATTLGVVFEQLLSEVERYHPEIDRTGLLEAMLQREAAMSSYIGQGVAIPHAYCGRTGDPLSVVGRLTRPLDVGAFDGEPVRLVLLLVSPAGQAQRHLEALGQLARLAANEHLLAQLASVDSDAEALRLVRIEHRLQATRRQGSSAFRAADSGQDAAGAAPEGSEGPPA